MTARRPTHISSFLDPRPNRRLAAVHSAGSELPDRFALRNALATDRDGRVRARAAARLGSRVGAPMIDALLEAAAHDELPSVREAAWRSLARAREQDLTADVFAAARRGAATEAVWWVRMAIAAVLARGPDPRRIADLREVLLDPFWRVRHTAIRALLALGADSVAMRQRILAAPVRSDVEGAAILYLQRGWNEERAESLEPDLATTPPTDPLWDPDPAVIAARLEDPDADPSLGLLIELLADAHESTRKLAARHLARRGEIREIRVALQWLDEPRIPYASACASRLAAGLGERAIDLVRDLLDDPPGAGALCWAAAWIGATRSTELAGDVAELLDHADARVREAAIGCLYSLRQVKGSKDRLLAIAARAEAEGEQLAATHALLRVGPELAATLTDVIDMGSAPPRLRRLLTREVAARHHQRAWLQAASIDADPATRALGIRALARADELAEAVRAEALVDPDPWIREAALDAASAPRLALADPDPAIRRRALRLCRDRSVIASSGEARDPGLRAIAAARLDPTSPDELAALLRLSSDRAPMVRAAAADGLEAASDDAMTELLSRSREDAVIRAGLTWLCRRFDDDAARHLEGAWGRDDLPVAARDHLKALRLALPETVTCSVPAAETRPPRPTKARSPLRAGAIATRRELGRTGMMISPLAISGVKDLSMGSLRSAYDAGVNLYFWEPRYHQLGAFLRRPEIAADTHVVAGSYHGTADAIEADVEMALRRLRRDHIDLFLLFWVRSAARLSPEVWDCLQRLKQGGKIRACGFSSHHRDIAANAIIENPWDAIMVRHSAAHTGAEERLLSVADEQDVGVLAFTSLCYGRLFRPSPARAETRAPDCYRYSLSQPGIDAVISAPARHRELVENLAVLETPTHDAAALASMREHGAWIYGQSKDFAALVRRTPRELPRAAASRLLSTRTTSD